MILYNKNDYSNDYNNNDCNDDYTNNIIMIMHKIIQ